MHVDGDTPAVARREAKRFDARIDRRELTGPVRTQRVVAMDTSTLDRVRPIDIRVHEGERGLNVARLVDEDLGRMGKRILRAARHVPIGVIIPALFNDLSSPAMQHIIEQLAGINFVKRIYISLAHSSQEEFQRGREIIQPIKGHGVLLWNDAPTVQSVLEKINQAVPLGARGKGSAVWTALGYALGKSEVSVLAFHDADIVTYDRGFLLRLLYPVVHLRYQFAKGFYVRYSDRLHGRVARLFYFPFVKALRDIIGKIDFLDYTADFRYPLSGDFAIFASITYDLVFPSDWGIEVGILVQRNTQCSYR